MSEESRPETAGEQQPETPTPEAEQLLPDGRGLFVETVRELLKQKNDAVVSRDDPVLMLVTVFNAFLAELEKTHARHREGLAKLLGDKTDGYVQGVREATDSIAQSLSDASVQGIRKIFHEHMASLQTFRINVLWTAAIVAVSALVNVAAFVLLTWKAHF